jgi:hypothetical protein
MPCKVSHKASFRLTADSFFIVTFPFLRLVEGAVFAVDFGSRRPASDFRFEVLQGKKCVGKGAVEFLCPMLPVVLFLPRAIFWAAAVFDVLASTLISVRFLCRPKAFWIASQSLLIGGALFGHEGIAVPLAALAIILGFERALFWIGTNHAAVKT